MNFDTIKKGVTKGAKTVFKGVGIAANKVGDFFTDISKEKPIITTIEPDQDQNETQKDKK